MNLKPNDSVYLVPFGNALYYNRNVPYVTGTVTKIGRKYAHIQISAYNTVQMELGADHAQVKGDCNAYYKVFESWQSYLNWKQSGILSNCIESYFRHSPKLPLSALEKIYDILHESDPTHIDLPLNEYLKSKMDNKKQNP